MNINKRFFFKRTAFYSVFFIFLVKNNFFIFSKKSKNTRLDLLKNFSFAKKKYHYQTVKLIFNDLSNEKKNFYKIIFNIEKRRKISHLEYKNKVKFLI
ncbi:MAG: hypothetical protein CFH28_00619 [Alphaproteobacteria bacterium MarineAlpha6_Bin6]|nr:MAG: hypothetical protein CFH28_00619 [Alphaproteobacteria bacterium MarineAlpha6_Bin6]PPR33292.1 MAG: hypothetical protein CFH27_00714 [Alphaproteobacteria bacterium MarineAlpha6_Bin5]|tara:strand:- start:315 stop:608 length:294 start_codon:yes stop_codon:yes gene_type:complete